MANGSGRAFAIEAADAHDYSAVVFVGGWGSGMYAKPRPGAGVVIIAVRPGASLHLAAAELRRGAAAGPGVGFLRSLDGGVWQRALDGFANLLRSYREPMAASAFGAADRLLPAALGQIATHGVHLRQGASRSSPGTPRAGALTNDLILFHGLHDWPDGGELAALAGAVGPESAGRMKKVGALNTEKLIA